jgi:hypothetical protein
MGRVLSKQARDSIADRTHDGCTAIERARQQDSTLNGM